MSIGRMVYLNGSDHDQLELVENDSIHITKDVRTFFLTLLKKNRKYMMCAINTHTHSVKRLYQ